MRSLSWMALALAGTAPLAAQSNDPDKAVAGGGTVPAGWTVRLDRAEGKMADVKFVPMGGGLHITLGPSGIFYRDADQVNGSFHAVATFNQTKAPTHPEAYGLFVGGNSLKDSAQTYIYFIVRGTGDYSIRQRQGATVTNISQGNRNGWSANDAVTKQDSVTGKATHKLEISGDAKTRKLSFSVNGKKIHEMDAPESAFKGVVGLRVNHNIDVHIDGFAVHKL
ncbi:MAG: hypothetical protein ACRENB_02930 [Gemmatimonadales bacterium]